MRKKEVSFSTLSLLLLVSSSNSRRNINSPRKNLNTIGHFLNVYLSFLIHPIFPPSRPLTQILQGNALRTGLWIRAIAPQMKIPGIYDITPLKWQWFSRRVYYGYVGPPLPNSPGFSVNCQLWYEITTTSGCISYSRYCYFFSDSRRSTDRQTAILSNYRTNPTAVAR